MNIVKESGATGYKDVHRQDLSAMGFLRRFYVAIKAQVQCIHNPKSCENSSVR